ncbi:MAG TPA: hypothetical protein VIZ62_12215 [Nitrososphaeraceae archaeon]
MTTTGCLILILILTTFTILPFALSHGTNQIEKNIVKETNHTLINPSSNETGKVVPLQKNATDLGANLTEGARNLIENIGEGVENLSK